MPDPDRFFKGHALGNDYIVVVASTLTFPLSAAAVRRLCHRHEGVGGDGVIAVRRSAGSRHEVEVWNPDGSLAEVSGNGLRIAALALAGGASRPATLEVRSAGRTYPVVLLPGAEVSIELPPAKVSGAPVTLSVAGRRVAVTAVDVGNPHAVLASTEVGDDAWPATAAALERHPHFPAGANVERVRVAGPATLDLDLHERGAGPTLASGTGACAAAAAALALGWCPPGPLRVRMAGGEVGVEASASRLLLTGPVSPVCEGRLAPELVRELARG